MIDRLIVLYIQDESDKTSGEAPETGNKADHSPGDKPDGARGGETIAEQQDIPTARDEAMIRLGDPITYGTRLFRRDGAGEFGSVRSLPDPALERDPPRQESHLRDDMESHPRDDMEQPTRPASTTKPSRRTSAGKRVDATNMLQGPGRTRGSRRVLAEEGIQVFSIICITIHESRIANIPISKYYYDKLNIGGRQTCRSLDKTICFCVA